MSPAVLLRMGRVSNLPTVWTNTAAGLVLAGATPRPLVLLALALAASSLYVAGMVLNDVHDAEIDARERPERPIPAGLVTLTEAAWWGYGLLALGVGIAAFAGMVLREPASVWPGVAATATAALVVLYDRRHKGNPVAPLIMGLCRMGVYAMAGAWAAPQIAGDLWTGAALLCMYVLGLTYVARFESGTATARAWPRVFLWLPAVWAAWQAWGSGLALAASAALALWIVRATGLVRRGGPSNTRAAVVSLIAGISLLDACFLAGHGHGAIALLALMAFGGTLALQRRIAGT